MVGPLAHGMWLALAHSQSILLADEQKPEPLWMRLDPETRAKVSMALLGIVLVGIALVALVWMGGRRLRRIAARPDPTARRTDEDWYRKPLNRDTPGPPQASDPQ